MLNCQTVASEIAVGDTVVSLVPSETDESVGGSVVSSPLRSMIDEKVSVATSEP